MRKLGALMMFIMATSHLFAQSNPLVGVWRMEARDQSGSAVSSEIVIQPNGQFSKLDNWGTQTLISGDIAVSADPPVLRLNIRNYEPKQWCGPLGCTPIQMIAAETYNFQVHDSDLLLANNLGRWVYHRAQ